jgi:chemotaxis protein methyltransferase CheR
VSHASQRIRTLVGEAGEAFRGGRPTGPPAERMPVPRAVGPALSLLRAERFADALDAVTGLPPDVRDDPGVRLLDVVLRTAVGDFAAAERVCRALLSADPGGAAAHYAMANCRHGMGDGAGAAVHSRTAADLDPRFAMPRLQLGLLAAGAGDRSAARRELSRARTLLPHEDATRLLLFGGGFSRADLIGLCGAQLRACGGTP